jgi:phosphate transport system permease protein
MNRKTKEILLKTLIYLAGAISVAILLSIVGFIFKNGIKLINFNYLTSGNNSVTQYVIIESNDNAYVKPSNLTEGSMFVEKYGIAISNLNEKETAFVIDYIDKASPFIEAKNTSDVPYGVKAKDEIKKINKTNTKDISLDEAVELLNSEYSLKLRLTRPGGGIYPMLISTLMLIGLSLLIAVPIGVFAAIYLVEYSKEGRFLRLIRFATESLSGIPSIVYGLFGMIFFVKFLGFGQSMVSGSLTLSIILLPTIIRTTEESLKTVPSSYKEGSFALGANRLQTLWKVIVPNALSGILVSIILSIGRIVGESAALLFTAGTFAKVPNGFFDSGASLTVRAYMEVKEYANIEMASGIGIVLLVIVFTLNLLTKFIVKISSKNA